MIIYTRRKVISRIVSTIWQLVDDNNELSIRLKCLEDE